MGFFDTKTKTTSSGSRTDLSDTENHLWDNPALQSFFNNYSSQYGDLSGLGPNSYMYNAANYGAGLAPGLAGAQGAAAGVTNNGITTADINKYMSPYTDAVVNKTIAAYGNIDAQAQQQRQAGQAMQRSLGNNTGDRAGALYQQAVQPQRDAQIAGLYNQGYQQAVDTAAKNAGIVLQGAGTQGNLTGVQSGANQNAFGQGYGIMQGMRQPYDIYNQGVQGFQGFGNLAGSNTTSSGTTNSTSVGTSSPSGFQIAAGLGGLALGALGGGFGGGLGALGGSSLFGGMSGAGGGIGGPMTYGGGGWGGGTYGSQYFSGTPASYGSLPWQTVFASGGAVGGLPSAEEPTDALSRFHKAFHVLDGIRRGTGGKVGGMPGYAGGGAPEFSAPEFNPWSPQFGEPTYANAPDAALSFNGITPYHLGLNPDSPSIPSSSPTDAMPIRGASALAAAPDKSAPTQDSLAAQGGMGATGSLATNQTSSIPKQDMLPQRQPQAGLPQIPQVPTPQSYQRNGWADLANGLMASSGNLVLGPAGQQFASNEQQKMHAFYQDQQARMDAWKAQRDAELALGRAEREVAGITGEYRGKPTMAGQKLPLELEHLEAGTIRGQKDVKTYEAQVAKDLEAQKQYAKSVQDINQAESYGILAPDKANAMKQNALDLYNRTRGQIQDVTTPAQRQPSRPAGNYTWTPESGIQ